jgi:hypothetical protein
MLCSRLAAGISPGDAFTRSSQRRKMHNGVACVHTARSRYANSSCVQVWGESGSPDFLHFAPPTRLHSLSHCFPSFGAMKNAEIYLMALVKAMAN